MLGERIGAMLNSGSLWVKEWSELIKKMLVLKRLRRTLVYEIRMEVTGLGSASMNELKEGIKRLIEIAE
jgi:hypothetical protein